MLALSIPFAVAGILLTPVFMTVLRGGLRDAWTMLICYDCIVGIPLFFLYQNPGLAALNHVSSTRMFLGTLLWTAVIGAVCALVAVAVTWWG